MHLEKSHYSLVEAAELAKCKPNDLLHHAVQGRITLLIGVPDWINVRIYDETTNSDIEPFLMAPQLLALGQSHCLKIEINGRTEQRDFKAGYLVRSSGELERILPSYGRPELDRQWVYWRTYRDKLVNLLELVPERLFVMHSDLVRISEHATKHTDNESIQIRKYHATKSSNKAPDCSAPQKAPINTCAGNDELNEVSDKGKKTQPASEAAKQSITTKLSTPPEPPAKSVAILRLKQVTSRTGLSRSTVYNKMDPKSPHFDSTFPKQISLGASSVGWYESEVIAWLESRTGVGSAANGDS